MNATFSDRVFCRLLPLILLACNENKNEATENRIAAMDLKRGAVISCGPGEKQFGDLAFETSCKGKATEDFNTALKLLHSFEYDEAEKMFATVIDEDPACAMAYWGVAMSNFHPLWSPSTPAELKKGTKAIEIATSISQKTKRESAYIEAIAVFYKDWDKTDHRTRCINF